MPLASGQTLKCYEIRGPLGVGGMGEVYRASDTRLEREVAIKVLPEKLAADEERLRRFEREAKTLASLNHPNIAAIHDIDRDGDVSFLVLELELLVKNGAAANWSPDGRHVYYVSFNESGLGPGASSITYQVPVDGGEPTRVRKGAIGLQVARDGTGYFMASDFAQGEIYRARPFDTGVREEIRTDLQSRIALWPHGYELSPDGRWLATPLRDRETTNLFVISTEDKTLRPVTDFGDHVKLIGRQVSWSEDSEHIFAAVMETDADIVLLEGALR